MQDAGVLWSRVAQLVRRKVLLAHRISKREEPKAWRAFVQIGCIVKWQEGRAESDHPCSLHKNQGGKDGSRQKADDRLDVFVLSRQLEVV